MDIFYREPINEHQLLVFRISTQESKGAVTNRNKLKDKYIHTFSSCPLVVLLVFDSFLLWLMAYIRASLHGTFMCYEHTYIDEQAKECRYSEQFGLNISIREYEWSYWKRASIRTLLWRSPNLQDILLSSVKCMRYDGEESK